MTKQLWTKEEEDRLIMMAAQGKTNRQIADALRRTERAVAHNHHLTRCRRELLH